MALSEPRSDDVETTMLTMALARPAPGVYRMTSLIFGPVSSADPGVGAVADWLSFPGVDSDEYSVRRFDAERGIAELDFEPRTENSVLSLWLRSVRVGSRHRIAGPSREGLPRFAEGKRVYMFADETALPSVADVLTHWPASAVGTLWIDTPHPSAVADLPVVDGVGIITFHVPMGFDPLVTAARRLHLDDTTTVWAAGEISRMNSIRDTCRAAGLSADDTRVFGYWSAESILRRG